MPQNLLIHAPNNIKPLPRKSDKLTKNRLGELLGKLKEIASRCENTLNELAKASAKLMNFPIKDAINIHIDAAFENVDPQAEITNTCCAVYSPATKVFEKLIHLLEELLDQHEQILKESSNRLKGLQNALQRNLKVLKIHF